MSLRDQLVGLGRRTLQAADGLLGQLAEGAEEPLARAESGNTTSGSGDSAGLASASRRKEYTLPTEADEDPRALYWDPFAVVEQLGYKDKPTAMTYNTLRTIVWRVPIIRAIIQTRINQVSAFAVPQKNRFDPGFRIKLRDSSARATRAVRKYESELETMIMQCGVRSDARYRDNFEQFLRKFVLDSLTLDQACAEIVPGRNGRPSEWYAVDAATIRLADMRKLSPDLDPQAIRTVQVYDNVVINEFRADEMMFSIRNPRTDTRSYGYGTSEIEMIMSTVTSILYAWNYNQNFFQQGTVAKGLLNLRGKIPERQLKQFRRQWYQQLASVTNAWRTPIVSAEQGVDWVNMQNSNRDMEFSAWMDFLIKVACACFQMDPIEVNFKYGTGSQKSMFDSGNRAKVVESKDRGLRPLLRFIGRELDRYIIHPIDEDFTIEFVGLDSSTPKELADLNTQRVRSMFTIDEIRTENDLPPLPGGAGEVILDSNWLAFRRELMARDQQAEQQAQAVAAAAATATSLTDAAVLGDAGTPNVVPANDGALIEPPPQQAGVTAMQAKPAAAGHALGAIPGKGGSKPQDGAEPPAGPDKDQIAELEGLLTPSHTSSISRSMSVHEAEVDLIIDV